MKNIKTSNLLTFADDSGVSEQLKRNQDQMQQLDLKKKELQLKRQQLQMKRNTESSLAYLASESIATEYKEFTNKDELPTTGEFVVGIKDGTGKIHVDSRMKPMKLIVIYIHLIEKMKDFSKYKDLHPKEALLKYFGSKGLSIFEVIN